VCLEVVNALLTDYFWGFVEEQTDNTVPPRWVCVSKQPTRSKPMLSGVDPALLMTYRYGGTNTTNTHTNTNTRALAHTRQRI